VTRWRATAAVLAAAAVALLGVGVAALVAGGGGGTATPAPVLANAVRHARPAHAPFRGLTETRIRVGGTPLRLVIADDEGERNQGLRGRRNLGRYGGMLFVFGSAADDEFTMSAVPVSLDIGFYDAHGHRITRLLMTPCAGTDSECPAYASPHPYRFALETLAGRLPSGDLRGG
jgi:uncharacterized membrane protein (UPF0127 family)